LVSSRTGLPPGDQFFGREFGRRRLDPLLHRRIDDALFVLHADLLKDLRDPAGIDVVVHGHHDMDGL
jgi:hypothetical protein